MLQDIDNPRHGYKPYAGLKRIIKKHLRSRYPPYWLVIYDNEHGVQHPNLIDLGNRVRAILNNLSQGGKIPASFKEVWLFDMPNAVGPTLLGLEWSAQWHGETQGRERRGESEKAGEAFVPAPNVRPLT